MCWRMISLPSGEVWAYNLSAILTRDSYCTLCWHFESDNANNFFCLSLINYKKLILNLKKKQLITIIIYLKKSYITNDFAILF